MRYAGLLMLLLAGTALGRDGEGVRIPRGAAVSAFPFYVYRNHESRDNHYFPSGFMGDRGDLGLTDSISKHPHEGDSCLRISYSGAGAEGQGWAGIYWQDPANNWGTVRGGYDLSRALVLEFWARGRNGGELVEFKLGGIEGLHGDSGWGSTGTVRLAQAWTRYQIALDDILATRISGGFCVVFTKAANPGGCIIYLDTIRYR